jgi:hypothetical protein
MGPQTLPATVAVTFPYLLETAAAARAEWNLDVLEALFDFLFHSAGSDKEEKSSLGSETAGSRETSDK